MHLTYEHFNTLMTDEFHIHIYFKMKLCPYCMEPFKCMYYF